MWRPLRLVRGTSRAPQGARPSRAPARPASTRLLQLTRLLACLPFLPRQRSAFGAVTVAVERADPTRLAGRIRPTRGHVFAALEDPRFSGRPIEPGGQRRG